MIKSMQKVTQEIYDTQSLAGVERSGDIVSVAEVFRLQNTAELKTAEAMYENSEEIHRRMSPPIPQEVQA